MIGMILSISKNKIFEVGDVDQKIEQAKIIMNEKYQPIIALLYAILVLGNIFYA